MITWIRNWWWSIQRNIDMQVLWPACKEQAANLTQARGVFAYHAFQDPAWIEYYGEARLKQVIDELS